jgi:hypothetical protein
LEHFSAFEPKKLTKNGKRFILLYGTSFHNAKQSPGVNYKR